MGYNGYTEKKKASNARYIENNNLVQLKIVIPEQEKKDIVTASFNAGISTTQFIRDAIKEKIERERSL